MKPTASELRTRARTALKGNWAIAIGVSLVAGMLGAASSSVGVRFNTSSDYDTSLPSDFTVTEEFISEALIPLLIIFLTAFFIGLAIGLALYLFGGIIEIGYCHFRLELLDSGGSKFDRLFAHFGQWKAAVLSRLLIYIYTFLWTLVFIIPGIMASYSYAMTGFVLYENPQMTATEAMRRSKEIMHGNRWRLFCLHFSFIGWSFLCIFTLGIGGLWLTPYTDMSVAAFYRDLVPLPVAEEQETTDPIDDTFSY